LKEQLHEEIVRCLVELDRQCVEEAVNKALSRGATATEIVLGPMTRAMEEIGRLFEEGEYFVAELMEAAEIFKSVMKKLEPLLREEASKTASRKRLRVVLGTVKGDIHDIGKNIVGVMMQAAGFEVIDLGVDVDAEKFADAVEKYNADVVGMSALLTTTASYMKKVIEELEKRGLRSRVFVIIGGAATTPQLARGIGADAWARNAVEAVRILSEVASRKIGAGGGDEES